MRRPSRLCWQKLPPVLYRSNMHATMVIAHSKLTTERQTSVPVEIQQKLGVGPGSLLGWGEVEEKIIVRRVGLYTSEDVHRALFPEPPQARTIEEMKERVRRHIRGRYARDLHQRVGETSDSGRRHMQVGC